MATILGISPGSRHIGLAVFSKGKLRECRTKCMAGRWSRQKSGKMLHELGEYMKAHRVTAIAVKIPDNHAQFRRLNMVIGAINVLCQREGIKCRYYTLSQLKRAYTKDWHPSKQSLIGFVVLKYPELQPEYYKAQTEKSRYYERMFEAVLVGHLSSPNL